MATSEVHEILKATWLKSATVDGWLVGRYVLMPDHVHLFAAPTIEAKSLADWMKTWKSISSRQIARGRHVAAPVWQEDYFDHFVRSVAAYAEKWEYVQQNPVRKGLCRKPEDWPYRGALHDLQFA